MEAVRAFLYVRSMVSTSAYASSFRVVREIRKAEFGALVHPEWSDAFAWLVQGTTARESGDDHPFDLGLFADGSQPESARRRWRTLRESLGGERVVHAHQVHGAEVRLHRGVGARVQDPHLVDDCDGHVADTPGVLLAVTTADCVPVFIVDPERRAVAALHAGWRGAASGVLERGIEVMVSSFSSRLEDLLVHLGPAICGACYEVGPEVFEALNQKVPEGPEPIDLREVIARRAVRAGVRDESISVSAHCTKCTDSGLFSHRAGHGERQAGFIGVRR